jgi:4-amino-4-deoxy-L-arabinose transferase-like glycosyltransferase
VTRVRFTPALAALSIAALAVRVAWILLGNWSPERVIGDAGFYHEVANLIADGHGYESPEHPGEPTALHPPLHPLVLASVSALGLTSWTAHRLVGALVGAVSVALIGLLGRRVGGERVGLIAAVLAACYPVFVRIDGAVLSEPLYGALIAACLLVSYRLLERPAAGSALALGGLIGLAALTRAEAVLLLPLLAVPVVWRAGGRRLLHAGLACLALAAALAPWTVRNLIELDRIVPVSTNSGTALAGANCAQTYRGPDIGLWQFFCLRARLPREDEVEHAARLRDRGFTYASEHSGRLPVVMSVRALRLFDLYQPLRQANLSEGGHITLYRIGLGAFYLLAVAGVAGAFLLRRRGQTLMILLAPFVLVTATAILVFGIPRFRFAAEPGLIVLAAVALARMSSRGER